LLFYRDLGAIGWPKKGELWQLSRKKNQMLMMISSKSREKKVAGSRQAARNGGQFTYMRGWHWPARI
jgi:hypothetical protein